jgi:plasmid stabilization system protein ParE
VKRYGLRTTSIADKRARRIHAWWQEHRSAAPNLFLTELEQALELLSGMPSIGAPYSGPKRGIRRLLLKKTRYFLYYAVDEQAHEVEIRSIGHASRGQGPKL